jgi:hypothetical protein
MSTKPSKRSTPDEPSNVVRFPAAQNSDPKVSPPPTDDEEPLSARALIGVGIFLVILVLGGVWLMNTLRDISKMQDCAMQGRRNCAPIETPRER